MKNLALKLAAAIAGVSLSFAAHATILTFGFSGHVLGIPQDDSSGTFSANFAVNDVVQGTWSVDSAAVPQVRTAFQFYDVSFSVQIGAHTFSGPAQYRHFDGHATLDDGFSVINELGTFTGPSLGPLEPRSFFIQYIGMPADTLSGFDLITDPASLIPLATFVQHGFRLDSTIDNSFGRLVFTLDSIQQVPEPHSLALLAIALAGLGFGRFRCRRI